MTNPKPCSTRPVAGDVCPQSDQQNGLLLIIWVRRNSCSRFYVLTAVHFSECIWASRGGDHNSPRAETQDHPPAYGDPQFSPIQCLLDELPGAGVCGGQDALVVSPFADLVPEDLEDPWGRDLIGQLGRVVLRQDFRGEHCGCETARGKGHLSLGLRCGLKEKGDCLVIYKRWGHVCLYAVDLKTRACRKRRWCKTCKVLQFYKV